MQCVIDRKFPFQPLLTGAVNHRRQNDLFAPHEDEHLPHARFSSFESLMLPAVKDHTERLHILG